MSKSIQEKIDALKKKFPADSLPDERYRTLIELGRNLPVFPTSNKVLENQVPGCQSILYLSSEMIQGKVFFEAEADALISAGLAALLISVYSGETPETILREAPQFLNDLGIFASLSPNRSNGLANIHLRMKKDALKYLVSSTIS